MKFLCGIYGNEKPKKKLYIGNIVGVKKVEILCENKPESFFWKSEVINIKKLGYIVFAIAVNCVINKLGSIS